MPEYQLYCFAQSGNAYRAALMLNLIGADWEPRFVDFFARGETRTPEYRERVNEMGEVPVLLHGAKRLSQSGVILTYLAERTGKFRPEGEDERLEALRWIIFDNQKLNGYLGPYRFLKNFAKPAGDPAATAFLQGRAKNSLAILDKRLAGRAFVLGERPTIADLSLVGYLYYPAEEFGFDIAAEHNNIAAWLDRIKVLPGWKHPYELMPGYPCQLNRQNPESAPTIEQSNNGSSLMPGTDTARSIEQLQNRIAAIKELPETVRSDLIVALGAAREESEPDQVAARLDAALAILERETGASAEAAEVAQAIRKLRPA